MTELGLFLSAFVSVFALGFQSLNVNGGHYRLAFLTSFAIGGGQLVLMRLIPDASVSEILVTLLGGPFGIHQLVRLKKPWRCALGLHAWERHTQISLGAGRAFPGWRCRRCLKFYVSYNVPPRRNPSASQTTLETCKEKFGRTDAPPRPWPRHPPNVNPPPRTARPMAPITPPPDRP
jgi:hypothetical protein